MGEESGSEKKVIPRGADTVGSEKKGSITTQDLRKALLTAGQYVGLPLALGGIYFAIQRDNPSIPDLGFIPEGLHVERLDLSVEEAKSIETSEEFNLVFPKLNAIDRTDALNWIGEASRIMNRNLGEEQLKNISKYEPLINQSAKAQNVPENLLLGLVATESLGDPNAVSPSGAGGMTQIMPLIAEQYGIDVFNPKENLETASKIINEEYEKFGDWGLALWSWHIGDPQIYKAVQLYVRLEYGSTLPDVNVEPVDDSQEAFDVATSEAISRKVAYKTFITQHNVNLFKLFGNQSVREMFSGEEWDKTLEYVPRILASIEIYKENSDSNQVADNTVNR